MKNQAIYKWEARHASIFNALVEKLNKSGVKYFILRNYEGLPEVNESKDIDIIIEPDSYKQAASFMYEVLKENNVPNYYVVRYERVRCWLGVPSVQPSFVTKISNSKSAGLEHFFIFSRQCIVFSLRLNTVSNIASLFIFN